MLDLSNPKDKASIQAIMAEGLKSDFWRLIVQYLSEKTRSVEAAQNSDSFKDLPADQYKVENEIYRARKEIYEKMKDLPAIISSDVEQPDQSSPNLDPY